MGHGYRFVRRTPSTLKECSLDVFVDQDQQQGSAVEEPENLTPDAAIMPQSGLWNDWR